MKNGTKGAILVVALWVLMFLSVLALIAGGSVRRELSLEKRAEETAMLTDIAYSGVMNALCFMKKSAENEETPQSDSLNDVWADNKNVFKKDV